MTMLAKTGDSRRFLAAPMDKSAAVPDLIEEARRYLVGGVNSPVRAFRHVGGEPVMLARGRGAEVTDTRGRTYLDFICGWGAHILGHTPPAVTRAIRQGLARGTMLGLTHPAEASLARLIADAVPSVELVRFTASGTEACMTAVKLARAVTGRPKILMFEGGYHGHADSLLAGKTAGVPEAVAKDTIRVPYDDPAAVDDALSRDGQEIACVIVEPVAANMGVVSPEPDFLGQLREQASRRGILLIFDEVVTGFRLGLGGAQECFGVRPDLTTFGKIIGGGLPVGALGGCARLMRRLAPEGDVYHGGTFAGHPLSMLAGTAVLTELHRRPPYDRLERLAGMLADGLQEQARAGGVSVRINRAASMLTVFFDRKERFARWAVSLRQQGILIPPSPHEALFLSTAHTEAHIRRVVRASRAAFAAARD
jgi:glutamate-1-semialdehyde 2,1-aminomutase